jgi:oxygen-independent coproporphyrinogen-3 oxidase
MDHFAKPNDELAIAQKNHQLHRNFQGYTTHQEYQLIGVGVSSIGAIGSLYHQNVRDIESYYQALEKNKLPSWRGVLMSQDDKIRKSVIFTLICHFFLKKSDIEQSFSIQFDHYFNRELQLLAPLQDDGLIILKTDDIQVTNKGRLLIRTICMSFDAYLNEFNDVKNFSNII